jgi:segregation and condensation protein B
MELSEIIPHIEVLIFASEKPLTSLEIVELINNAFGFMEERITLDQVESCMEGIREKYQSEFYPFEVRESGGGWQFLTKKEFHRTVAQLNGDKFLKRLSNAAIETLAIIAYKQPITKGEIEAIRGVNSDYSIQKLLEKELIIITGRNEELPGKPLVYSTSKTFMDYFGINSADDLPKIKEVLAEQMVEPTIVNHGQESDETADTEAEQAAALLAVDSNGDLVTQPLSAEEQEAAAAESNAGEETAEQEPATETDESVNIATDESVNIATDETAGSAAETGEAGDEAGTPETSKQEGDEAPPAAEEEKQDDTPADKGEGNGTGEDKTGA